MIPTTLSRGGESFKRLLQITPFSAMFFRPFTQRDTANPGRGIPATAAAAKAPPLHSEKISRFAVYCYICGRIFISDTMTQHISYPTVGTCSRQIDIELEEGVIRSVTFTGGCSGNTQGVAALVRGMKAADAVARLEGIDCRGKGTSCPDQLAKALKQAL